MMILSDKVGKFFHIRPNNQGVVSSIIVSNKLFELIMKRIYVCDGL